MLLENRRDRSIWEPEAQWTRLELVWSGGCGVMEVCGSSFEAGCIVWGHRLECRQCRRDDCFERMGGIDQSGHQKDKWTQLELVWSGSCGVMDVLRVAV